MQFVRVVSFIASVCVAANRRCENTAIHKSANISYFHAFYDVSFFKERRTNVMSVHLLATCCYFCSKFDNTILKFVGEFQFSVMLAHSEIRFTCVG